MKQDTALRTLCENLKILRIRNHLTQEEVARRLNIGVKSVRMLERGALPERAGCELLFRAASVFCVSVKELFLPMS